MTQIAALLDTLKQELRRQGRTYREAAAALELSEATMKRLFSTRSFSLERLDSLCQWLGLEISDLVQLMENSQSRINQLTEAQESELVSDIKLLLMAHSLLNHWAFEDVIATFRVSKTEGIRLLARLDRMGIIQLQPGNRVRLLISRNFQWLPNGPIQRFFEQHVQSDFFQSRFDGPGECRVFLSGMLSRRANQDILRRMEKLAAEFNALHREDESLPLAERFGSSLVLAIRPWEVKVFEALRREPNQKRFR